MALMVLFCLLSLARNHLYGILAAPLLYKISTVTANFSPPMPRFSVGGLGPAKDIWVAPANMKDLTSFGITSFPNGGRKNLQIVTKIPVNAWGDGSNATSTNSDDSTSMLQLLFPENSVDPAKKPIGGAEFYASPLDISSAQNVSLKYSAFFPSNFDFALAGKMPGLFGGHTGCSGGNPANSCFSTRLMWRINGAGELYLVRLNCPAKRRNILWIFDSMRRKTNKLTPFAWLPDRSATKFMVYPLVERPLNGPLEIGQQFSKPSSSTLLGCRMGTSRSM